MSTRSVIARKTPTGFTGVYHHWDGYPSGLGSTLFEVRKTIFAGDTGRMLKYLIDCHPAGWSTINADWSKPEGYRPDDALQICTICGKESWRHYRQYYKDNFGSPMPSPWERAGRPEVPATEDPNAVQVLGHSCKAKEETTGPEPYGGKGSKITHLTASGCGCEWAYVFNGNGKMEIQSSYCETGEKMIGMFGCGDPKATWQTVAVVDLDGPEPNWQAIENKVNGTVAA